VNHAQWNRKVSLVGSCGRQITYSNSVMSSDKPKTDQNFKKTEMFSLRWILQIVLLWFFLILFWPKLLKLPLVFFRFFSKNKKIKFTSQFIKNRSDFSIHGHHKLCLTWVNPAHLCGLNPKTSGPACGQVHGGKLQLRYKFISHNFYNQTHFLNDNVSYFKVRKYLWF
jgi:hypothetical protein